MRPLLLSLAAMVAMTACSSTNNWPAAPAPDAEEEVTVEISDPGLPGVLEVEEVPLVCAVRNGADGRSLLLGLWADGRLVWSEDPVFGGAPYLEARLGPTRLSSVLRCFALLFDRWDGDVLEHHSPGADHVVLICRVAGRDRRMASWHEIFERDADLVVTQDGVVVLDGRPREVVLATRSADYLRFRVLWSDVRRLMAGLPPAEAPESAGDGYVLPAPR